MVLNGKECPFKYNPFNAKHIKQLELAQIYVDKNNPEPRKEGESAADWVYRACDVIFRFFDIVLGDGASDHIFEGEYAIDVCYKTFQEFLDWSAQEEKRVQNMFKKYDPSRIA